jgi:hypothetical protein
LPSIRRSPKPALRTPRASSISRRAQAMSGAALWGRQGPLREQAAAGSACGHMGSHVNDDPFLASADDEPMHAAPPPDKGVAARHADEIRRGLPGSHGPGLGG